ncbi:Bromodomain-containing protein 4A [Linum perenne]
MKTKRRRGRPKTKNVAHVAPAAAPASPEHDPPADNVTAESPLSATAALNANKVAFLNLVGQIAQENLALDKSNDAAGLHGVRSASHSSSSSSSLSSKGDDSFHVDDINGGFEEPEVDWRPTQSGRKRGRPSKGDVSSKGASNVQVTSSSGLHPWSSKDGRSKKSCQDPRYNERELKIALAVIKKIMEMDEAASFSSPIEPVPVGFNRGNVEDTPMDFGTICNNIQASFKYLNSFDVYADVERIWEHCLKYNKKGDYIVYLMKRVKKKFLKYWTSAGLHAEGPKDPTGLTDLVRSNDRMIEGTNYEASLNPVGNRSQKQPSQVTRSTYSHQPQVPPSSYNHPAQVPPSSYNHQELMPPSSYSHPAQLPPSSYNHQEQMPPSSYSHPAQVPPSSYYHHAQVPQSSYSHQAQLPTSRYSHDYELPQLQPTTGYSPRSPQSQSRIHTNDAGHSYAPSADSRKLRRNSRQQSVASMSTHSEHPPQSSLYYVRRPVHRASQQQLSQSLVQENDDGHGWLPAWNGNLGQNGTTAVNPTITNQTQLQPQKPPVSHSQQCVPYVPEESIRQNKHHEQSHAGGVNGRRKVARCSKGYRYTMEVASPSFQSPSHQDNNGNHSSPCSSEETIAVSKKRGRGPSRCRFVWDMPEGHKLAIPINDLGQPFGSESRKLASFLGTLARDGTLAPLNYPKWSAVPQENKENMWKMVQEKCDIDPMARSFVLKSLSIKWTKWRAKLKADYFSYKTDDERMRNLDRRVIPDQWPALIEYWNTEEVQLLSAKNKANRANVKDNHRTSGSKSYATVREEERAKRADGKAPTRAEMYILTHTDKDGNPVDENAAEVIAKLQEKASQRQQNSEASGSSHDTFYEVMGEEKKGNVRMLGLGPTPATLWGRKCGSIQFSRMATEAKKQATEEAVKVCSKVEVLEQKQTSMEEKFTSMEAQIARMNSNMELMLAKLGVPVASGSVQLNQVGREKSAPENPLQVHEESSSASGHASFR